MTQSVVAVLACLIAAVIHPSLGMKTLSDQHGIRGSMRSEDHLYGAVLATSNGKLRYLEITTNVFQQGLKGNPIARANFSKPSAHASNFGQLHIETSSAYSDELQLRAAGFVEGYITAELTFNHWYNVRWFANTQCNDTYKIIRWCDEQDQWAQHGIEQWRDGQFEGSANETKFWSAMALVMAQFDGMLEGYNAAVSDMGPRRSIDFMQRSELLVANAMGDFGDLAPWLCGDSRQWDSMTPDQVRMHVANVGRCSALIKVTGDLSDLLMGHATWWQYNSMTRIYKHYNLGLQGSSIRSRRMSFSSYPGLVSSMDDWYILDSGLVITETTNEVHNRSLYALASGRAATSWQRMRVASFLAASGAEWAEWLSMHNSGTYNNQYMVVDLKLFTPGAELRPGLLTVAEQIPGQVVWADATQDLERGYWPSYNVPYFKEVYDKMGFKELADRLRARGPEFEEAVAGLDYQRAPRANIFRRDNGRVTDLASLMKVLRSNDYQNDPYSGQHPRSAICGRGDLDPSQPSVSGCTDAKVASYALALNLTAWAVTGPTQGSGLPVFAWSSSRRQDVAHRGMPDAYDFSFELQAP